MGRLPEFNLEPMPVHGSEAASVADLGVEPFTEAVPSFEKYQIATGLPFVAELFIDPSLNLTI
jgi:hypothetical protein